ncbi:hypothetical protein B6U93_03005 [Candidatus Woesearchaeota archaeon ex4484_78]|nr:MAG: hypothetical protein B6U93_03005 [Candidatus Woesearchaeota archaeon ex4484_78]
MLSKILKEIADRYYRMGALIFQTDKRLEELDSFAILGIDLKITPENEIKIIEINGVDSGLQGFKKADPESHNEDNFNKHLNKYGRLERAYIGKELKKEQLLEYLPRFLKTKSNGEKAIKEILLFFKKNKLKQKYGTLIENLKKTEKILQDKKKTDNLFYGHLRLLKPKSHQVNLENLEKLMKENTSQYIVIKPKDGRRGDSIAIYETQQLESLIEKMKNLQENKAIMEYLDSYIAETFILSKPIKDKEGIEHDGCMRYVLILEKLKTGELKTHHFGGYWRLSKLPIQLYGHPDAMKANLCKGAPVQKATNEELEQVKETMNEAMPEFYKRLLKTICQQPSFSQTPEKSSNPTS